MGRKLHLGITFTALAIAAWACCSTALADRRGFKDPRGDSQGKVDIASAVADHEGGLLRHTIVTYGRFRTTSLQHPCIFTDGPTGKYRICGHVVYNYTRHRRSGSAQVRRPNAKTIVYLFPPSAIGNPRYYRWDALSVGFPVKGGRARACIRTSGFCDVGPKFPVGIRHQLR